jgi:uncharacterized protein YbcC (UPF0753/DUF2309 family)
MTATHPLDAAIDAACAAIAPTWPLDQFIAVNPYWGWVDQPVARVDAALGRLSGSRLLMPREQFHAAFRAGAITREHLALAISEACSTRSADALIAALDAPRPEPLPLPLLSNALDVRRDLAREPAWVDAITHQVSQFCAAYFDGEQADWHPGKGLGLYAGWRECVRGDRGIGRLMGDDRVAARAAALPATPREAIAQAIARLAVPADLATDVLRATLLRINGWAAWCAYQRWQARLAGRDDEQIVELLAIRLGWETMLDDGARGAGSDWARWQQELRHAANVDAHFDNGDDWLWQRALELAWQVPVAQAIAHHAPHGQAQATVQAVFCIDVRSEVFRRALEQAAPTIETAGFAGFFGLPIQYTPLGTTATRPQLPGLLAPALDVTEGTGDARADAAIAGARRDRLARKGGWLPFKRLPGSAFTLVETVGMGELARLLRHSLVRGGDPAPLDATGLGDDARAARPQLQLGGDRAAAGADLARKVLHALGLEDGFARLVMLAGHGSRSANNPHAAGLDCGACCGQTGEVNARALANLLNDAAVRAALAAGGLAIPASTHFLAALHDTTVDEIALFDRDLVPATHAGDLAALERALAAAGAIARRERAPALGLSALADRPAELHAAVRARATDWAQTRPEWALADNAGFIVAPRRRTRGIALHGKTFMHDYDHRRDADGAVLELIMTAPMVVTHWINMQYHASTVDPRRYGAGNKVLHNVVGGTIGVFEGNGGDLRIGLPWQSVHDGERFMHTPRRLSVFIEAPQAMIEAVIAKHAIVRQLVENGWLHLFRIDPGSGAVSKRGAAGWTAWSEAPAQAA